MVVHNIALYWLGGAQDDFAWWCTIRCCQSRCTYWRVLVIYYQSVCLPVISRKTSIPCVTGQSVFNLSFFVSTTNCSFVSAKCKSVTINGIRKPPYLVCDLILVPWRNRYFWYFCNRVVLQVKSDGLKVIGHSMKRMRIIEQEDLAPVERILPQWTG